MPSMSQDIARSGAQHNKIANVEAEQALLGAVLFDNEIYHRLPELAPEAFYDPVHGRIFAMCATMIRDGELADGVTLKERFAKDGGIKEIGGADYLLTLLENAAPLSSQAQAYAELINELAQRRRLEAAGENAMMLARHPPHDASIDDLISRAQAAFDDTGEITTGFKTLGEAAEDFLLGLDEPVSQAISTGITNLDQRLGGGFFRGDLIVLAGRPSMGKSALANNFARNAASIGRKVGVFSQEMSAESIAMRALAAAQYRRTDIGFDRFSYSHLRNGAPNINRAHLAAAAKDLARLPILIDDRVGLTVAQIERAARAMKRKLGGLDLVVIDYLQILGRPEARGLNLSVVIGQMTQALKVMARRLNIAVVLLSQLNRGLEQRDDKRPQLSDLRESGNIEQDADVVLAAFREEYYLMRSEPRTDDGGEKLARWTDRMAAVRDTMEIITLKQRNGPVGTDVAKALVQYDLIWNARGV